MILIDFIKNNENWREMLSDSPYNISIKEKDRYALFKYNQLESDMSNPLVQVCRGIIIDLEELRIVCYPFSKFFNVQESNAAKLEGEIRAEEKVDGNLVKIWKHNGNINVSTNGMIDARDAEILMPIDNVRTYRDVFDIALENAGVRLEDFKQWGDYTLLFELVSPMTRIVVPYITTELYFLGMRNNNTGVEIGPYDVEESILTRNFKRPELYDIKTPEQAIEIAKTLGPNKEGFVLVDNRFNRVKVKGTEYLAKHLLRNNTLSTKRFVEIILKNEQDDLIAFFPEYKDIIKNLEDKLNMYISSIEKAITETNFNQDRKSFALEVKNNKNASILFKLYEDRGYDWKGRTVNISNINKIMSHIGA